MQTASATNSASDGVRVFGASSTGVSAANTDISTASTASTASSEKEQRRARRRAHSRSLAQLQHRAAARVAAHARALERHARALHRLHARLDRRAAALAGPDYSRFHRVGFELIASPAHIHIDAELPPPDSFVVTRILDVVAMAGEMAAEAAYNAAHTAPPPLDSHC